MADDSDKNTIDELKSLVTDYAKQQTLDPLKRLGDWVKFGFACALFGESIYWTLFGRVRHQPVRLQAVLSQAVQIGLPLARGVLLLQERNVRAVHPASGTAHFKVLGQAFVEPEREVRDGSMQIAV